MEQSNILGQDIRIVQLRNFYGFNDFRANGGKMSYRAFSYFDEITVHPVSHEGKDEDKHAAVNLYDGYRVMQELFRTNLENQYRSQQLIMAFTEVENAEKRMKSTSFGKQQLRRRCCFSRWSTSRCPHLWKRPQNASEKFTTGRTI